MRISTEELILQVLRNKRRAMSISTLSSILDMRGEHDIEQALTRLERRGQLEQGPGNPARTWQLPERK